MWVCAVVWCLFALLTWDGGTHYTAVHVYNMWHLVFFQTLE